MKILFALDKFSYGGGGASRTAHQVVKTLIEAGHSVTILEHDGKHSFAGNVTSGVTIHRRKLPRIGDNSIKTIWHNRLWAKILADFIRDDRPDLILTQGYLAPSIVEGAKGLSIRVKVFMHGLELFDPNFFLNKDPFSSDFNFWSAGLRQKLKYPLMKSVLAKYSQMLRTADTVIANSKFMQKLALDKLGVEAKLLYPPIDVMTTQYELPQINDDSPILFIKPQAIKGVSVVYHVAKAHPRRKFLIIGKPPSAFRSKLARLPNVEVREEVADLKPVYQQSALILGPSLIPEPFGRVFVEAGFFGVPAVAFHTGGISESVGDGGILLGRGSSHQEWCAAIEEVLTVSNYPKFSHAAYSNASSIAETSRSGMVANFPAAGDS